MSLTIGIQRTTPAPLWDRICPDEPVVQFNNEEDGGYYWYLYPVFVEVENATGQVIDLYGDAEFRGDQLTTMRRALVEAQCAAEDQPERWVVNVGTSSMPNKTPPQPPQIVWKEVEKAKLIDLLDRLIQNNRPCRL